MLLIPWNHENHTLLIVAQLWRQDDARISITAFDTAPWMSKKDQRRQMHRDVVQILRDHGWLEGVTPPANTYWLFAEAHTDPKYAIIHTVLSAWCVSMGLKLNWSFQPETSGEELIERCVENEEPPPTEASGRSHTFLAVLQQYEYEDDGTCYQIHLLDSSPSVFERQRESLFQWIVHIAYSLKWPMQRNWNQGKSISLENKVFTLMVAR
ncbi:hypothetical protein BKA63DRAFT_573153 [Paraphoma chrysanthemicola]|nr:hypothetical protein BKA63DRAFT_573153 [Paraphoma chrysanthemicola]